MNRFLKYGTLISSYGLITCVLLQIFARFLLPKAPPWTEEAARLFFIYAMAFAAGLAIKSKEYVALDLFSEKLTPTLQKKLLMLVQGLTLLLFGIMTIYALDFVRLGISEFSPSMNISMAFAFFSMFLMGASVSFFAFIELRKLNKRNSDSSA